MKDCCPTSDIALIRAHEIIEACFSTDNRIRQVADKLLANSIEHWLVRVRRETVK